MFEDGRERTFWDLANVQLWFLTDHATLKRIEGHVEVYNVTVHKWDKHHTTSEDSIDAVYWRVKFEDFFKEFWNSIDYLPMFETTSLKQQHWENQFCYEKFWWLLTRLVCYF